MRRSQLPEPDPSPQGTDPPSKEARVQAMFSSIARYYDLNNTLLSLGRHYAWKRAAVQMVEMKRSMVVLDLCAGTSDIAIRLGKQWLLSFPAPDQEDDFRIVALDLNLPMLKLGQQKIRKAGLPHSVTCIRGRAESLDFQDQSFDLVTVAFGVRNLSDLKMAFSEIHRVLKPGGQVVCLEFSRPCRGWLRALYHFYSFRLIPCIGAAVSGDRTGIYQYLPDSIRAFPDQEGLKTIMETTGFQTVRYTNLTGGIVAVHMGYRKIH